MYKAKQSEGKCGKETFGLTWEVKEWNDVNESGQQLVIDCSIP